MTPPDALATRTDESSVAAGCDRARIAAGTSSVASPRAAARELVEIPGHLPRLARGADDLPRRLPARHDPPVPADGHHDPPLAGHLRRLGTNRAGQSPGQVPLQRDDRLPAADQYQPHVLQHARPGRRDRPRDPRRDDEALPAPAHRHDRLPARLSGRAQSDLHHHVVSALCSCCSSSAAGSSTGFPTR